MKYKFYPFIFLMGYFSYAQVGIGIENPTATLDIKASNNTTDLKAINIENSDGNNIFSLYNNGNLSFEGAFMPNGEPGEPGQILTFDGENKPPKWATLDKNNFVYDAMQVSFNLPPNSSEDLINSFTRPYGSSVTLNFANDATTIKNYIPDIIEILSYPSIGFISIKKKGIYIITWNNKNNLGEYETATATTNENYSRLNYSKLKENNNRDFFYYQTPAVNTRCGSTTCNPFYTPNSNTNNQYINNSSTNEIVLLLDKEDRLSLEVFSKKPTGTPANPENNNYTLYKASIQIKYIPIPNDEEN